jgi:hypothetical protein
LNNNLLGSADDVFDRLSIPHVNTPPTDILKKTVIELLPAEYAKVAGPPEDKGAARKYQLGCMNRYGGQVDFGSELFQHLLGIRSYAARAEFWPGEDSLVE